MCYLGDFFITIFIRQDKILHIIAFLLCREGLFVLPYNELAVAQGPKIHQKNEL